MCCFDLAMRWAGGQPNTLACTITTMLHTVRYVPGALPAAVLPSVNVLASHLAVISVAYGSGEGEDEYGHDHFGVGGEALRVAAGCCMLAWDIWYKHETPAHVRDAVLAILDLRCRQRGCTSGHGVSAVLHHPPAPDTTESEFAAYGVGTTATGGWNQRASGVYPECALPALRAWAAMQPREWTCVSGVRSCQKDEYCRCLVAMELGIHCSAVTFAVLCNSSETVVSGAIAAASDTAAGNGLQLLTVERAARGVLSLLSDAGHLLSEVMDAAARAQVAVAAVQTPRQRNSIP